MVSGLAFNLFGLFGASESTDKKLKVELNARKNARLTAGRFSFLCLKHLDSIVDGEFLKVDVVGKGNALKAAPEEFAGL